MIEYWHWHTLHFGAETYWGGVLPHSQEPGRTYRANVLTKGKGLKGLRGRWLAQDAGDTDTGFAVSLWDSQTDMQAYEQSQ